jgi:hypothetical protein
MQLDIYFSQVSFLTDSTVVTSLVSSDPRIVVDCAGTNNTAAVGPLSLSLALEFLVDQVDPGGWFAFKSFDPVKQIFHAGPICAGVYAESNNIELTGDVSSQQTINSELQTVYAGRVGLTVVSTNNREIFSQLVRVDGASETYYEDVMYLALSASEDNDLRISFNIPYLLDFSSPAFVFNLRLMGTESGTLPQLTVTYRRIPAAGSTPTLLPATDSSLTITTVATLTEAYQYVDVAGIAVDIVPGDDVLITVARSNSDSYLGDVGILRMSGTIVAA